MGRRTQRQQYWTLVYCCCPGHASKQVLPVRPSVALNVSFFFDWKTLHLSRKIAWRNSLGAPFKGTADRGRHRWILVSGRRDWTASLDFCVRDGSFGQFRTIRTAPASRRQRQRTEQRPRTTTGTLFIVDQHVNGPEVCVALPSMAI